MRRTGFTGDIWPDGIQELLLRAALMPGHEGAAAWTAVRPRIDVDHLPGELHRLIPLLWKALADGGIDDPDLSRLKGVYQFSWYRNQLLFADGAALIAALEAAGVRTMLLRGGAMAVAHHRDAGIRLMNDLDVLVTAADLDRSRRLAEAGGWWPLAGSKQFERREAAVTLQNREGRIIRLHWTPSRNVPLPEASEAMWRRPVSVTFKHVETRVPSAADHLLYACIDGARANSGSTLRWIGDVTVLLRVVPDINWDVLVAEARRHRVSLLIGEALRYLVDTFDAGVPPAVLAALAAAPATRRDRLAHRLSLTTSPRMPSAAEVLGRHTRLTADIPLSRAVATAPTFLQDLLGAQRRRDVPAAVARKAVRAVMSPAPSMAESERIRPAERGRRSSK
jgi:Uncharacterised nucleotidyltransferase